MASIKTVLDLDRSNFDKSVTLGAQKFQAAFGKLKAGGMEGGDAAGEKLGSDIERGLHRKFGAGHSIKGLLMGAGFGSVEKIAEKISEYWKMAAESATKIAEESERALKATLGGIKDRQNPTEQRLTAMKEYARMQRDLKELTESQSGIGQMGFARGLKMVATGKGGDLMEYFQNETKKAALAAQINEKGTEIDKLKLEEKKKLQDEEAKTDREAGEIKRKREYESLSIEQKIAEQKHIQAESDRAARGSGSVVQKAEARKRFEEASTELVKLQKEQTDERIKEYDEWSKRNHQHQKRENDLVEKRKTIEKEIADIKSKAAKEAANELKPTLTGSAGGHEGTPTQGAVARDVMSLRDRAASVMRAGGNAWRDEKGMPISAADYSKRLTDRAKQLAGNTFKSDVSSGTDDKLAKAAAELKEAAAELKSVAEWGDPDQG